MTPDSVLGMARRVRRVHMVGVGGVGMSGIAEVLVNLGYEVVGTDIRRSDVTARLEKIGVKISQGHISEAVEGADVVVVSSAIKEDNVEVLEARRTHIPVIQRAEMLAELMRLKLGVAVAGAHGKTTTTSMIASILAHAQVDPTVVVGGKLNAVGSTAQLGRGPVMVVEADESDGTFLHLSPTIAVVTNIDTEHLDHYQGGLQEIRKAFRAFLDRLPFYGLAVLCGDHPEIQALLPTLERRAVVYGFSPQTDLRAVDVSCDGPVLSFEVRDRSGSRGLHRLNMLGHHNVQNALAALAVAEELGVGHDEARNGLEAFKGVDRRFSVRGEVKGILVVDDYGHHPTEIRATLQGARMGYPGRRLIAVFQPHRYSRTRELLDDFGRAFHDADFVFVLPVFSAGEDPIEGIDSERVLTSIRGQGHRKAELLLSLDEAALQLSHFLKSGDLLVIFGAGDVGRLGREVVLALES